MPSAVVTSTNSGIGHTFAQTPIKESYKVIATDITIGDKLKRLDFSIQAFKHRFKDDPLDLLLNIGGVMSPTEQDALETVDEKILAGAFSVNTFGPILLTQALLPNLLKSNSPRLEVMSSRVGSIGDNSTAALNSIFKSVAVDLKDKGVVVVIMHPEFVKTSLDPSTHALKEAVEPS
ncbi:NAD(P)-binding protein [Glonium stellatum]|uniref:NAD(P)-binding protein n=1 Tax=Glonium stellatum TaxID=574774 RepID=A0A8E2FCK1_9PEZI|nr:NAD(P)-binding protein [Glonium stellatum]